MSILLNMCIKINRLEWFGWCGNIGLCEHSFSQRKLKREGENVVVFSNFVYSNFDQICVFKFVFSILNWLVKKSKQTAVKSVNKQLSKL